MDELTRVLRLLAAAILYEREKELGRFPVDFVAAASGRPGQQVFADALDTRFAKARLIDLKRPDHTKSTFLTDVGILAVSIGRANEMFTVNAPQSALLVVERLLLYEGWRLRRGESLWRAAITAVNLQPAGAALDYATVIRTNWHYTGERVEDAFADVGFWWAFYYGERL